MKIWDKGKPVDDYIIDFTAAKDRIMDKSLVSWDIVGTMAHCVVLSEAGIVSQGEKEELLDALDTLLRRSETEGLEPGPDFEDIHSRIESELVALTGIAGRKIHTGRSRNDQVLTAICLYLRSTIAYLASEVHTLQTGLLGMGGRYKAVMLPGYTHLQPAMPSTFGLWFASYAESLCDDLEWLAFAYKSVNASPAGTAAGYGTTIPLNREKMADLLQFERVVVTSPYAQMSRGRIENTVATAIASLASSLSAFAGNICLFLSKEFSFLYIDESLSTGSSIMPQKKNPDVFEIIRARSNVLKALPNTISLLVTNLPPGYNRDFQVIKEVLFPALDEIVSLTRMTSYMLGGISVREGIIDKSYNSIFAAEAANRLAVGGIPFRDAYRAVAVAAEKELFTETTPADYTHLGSPGNPGFAELSARASVLMARFLSITATGLASRIRKY